MQDLTLGVDTGSGTFATAVSRDNGDIVYLSEVILRNDITDKMTRRREYRRNRRHGQVPLQGFIKGNESC